MTAPSIARSPRTQPGAVAAAPRRGLPRPLMLKLASSARLVRSLGAATMVVAMIGLIELLGRPAGIEPAVVLPLLVAGAAFAFGLSGALVAGVPGAVYAVVYYGQPAWSSVDGNGVRVLASVLVSGFAAWLVVLLRDRIEIANADVAAQHERNRAVVEFATVLANEAPDSVPEALVAGASRLFEADMCVLTILDPPSGRHVVRAVHGTAASALGIEIVPGVGITGQAIRDRKLVSAGNASQEQSRQTTAALPVLQAGRVVATLTIGRSNGRPFDDDTTWAIDQVCAMFRDGEPPETLFRSVEAALETARWSGPGAVVSI